MPRQSLPTKLEEALLVEDLPTELIVQDPHLCTTISEIETQSLDAEPTASTPLPLWQTRYGLHGGYETSVVLEEAADGNTNSLSKHAIRFVRAVPPIAAQTPPQIAKLSLEFKNLTGIGKHATVYRATIKLPEFGDVTVIAKLNLLDENESELKMFKREGRVLAEIGRDVGDGDALVPKFFGFYEWDGVDVEGNGYNEERSGILLMEDCGQSVQTLLQAKAYPNKMEKKVPRAWKEQMEALLKQLHDAQWTHGSYSIRNIAIQPGPLTAKEEERSMDTPSFRILDVGKACHFRQYGWAKKEDRLEPALQFDRKGLQSVEAVDDE